MQNGKAGGGQNICIKTEFIAGYNYRSNKITFVLHLNTYQHSEQEFVQPFGNPHLGTEIKGENRWDPSKM